MKNSVLIVEDEQLMREVIKDYFVGDGYDVYEAKTGIEAIDFVECRDFDIILLDPPYAEVFLENALKCITEIDILETGGIIVTERPVGKELPYEFEGYTRSKDYKYGNTLITLYRKG